LNEIKPGRGMAFRSDPEFAASPPQDGTRRSLRAANCKLQHRDDLMPSRQPHEYALTAGLIKFGRPRWRKARTGTPRPAQGKDMGGDVGKRDAILSVANEHARKENVGTHRPRIRCMILC
jgi:hypothetical protein